MAQVNDPIVAAAALLATDPERALAACSALLGGAPNDPRLLLIRGSALRRLGRTAQALAVLRPLAAAYPKAARTQYELGAVLLLANQPAAAESALRRAL